FDPFYTTKAPGKGTGLGLAMVYGCAQAHGGWVVVRSREGRGSVFELYLPLVAGSEPSSEETVSQEAEAGSGTVLFVDDSDAVLGVGKRLLERIGYRVLAAADGEEALALYRSHAGEVRAVITDLIMPKMGGRELLKQLRSEAAGVPVIATSGYAFGMRSNELLAEGFDALLTKPFRRSQLADLLQETLATSHSPPESPGVSGS
ncbi:MAG: response regulator, partial [Planctomycetes bacterium]|nr:response regulator [Planctomycetota bacterium]